LLRRDPDINTQPDHPTIGGPCSQGAVLSGIEFAYLSRAAFAGLVGLFCTVIAVPLLITALNSFRDSMAPGGPRGTRNRSHRLMRLFRSYVLIGIAGLLVVIGILKLTSTDTWLALFDPRSFACIETECQ
jgi:hypothetical protein